MESLAFKTIPEEWRRRADGIGGGEFQPYIILRVSSEIQGKGRGTSFCRGSQGDTEKTGVNERMWGYKDI